MKKNSFTKKHLSFFALALISVFCLVSCQPKTDQNHIESSSVIETPQRETVCETETDSSFATDESDNETSAESAESEPSGEDLTEEYSSVSDSTEESTHSETDTSDEQSTAAVPSSESTPETVTEPSTEAAAEATTSAPPAVSTIETKLNHATLNPVRSDFEPLMEQIDALFAEILHDDMTTYEKVKACYDYLINNCSYGKSSYEYHYIDQFFNGYKYEVYAYSILASKIGVCTNYSAAFAMLMRTIGLDCYVVNGQTHLAGGGYTGHAWCEMNLDGTIYVFDPQVEDDIAKGGAIYYYRFGKTYDELPDKYILNTTTTPSAQETTAESTEEPTEADTEKSTEEPTEAATEDENKIISVAVRTLGGEYEEGYKLTKADLSVTAKFISGVRESVTDYTIYQSGTSLYVIYAGVKSNTLALTFKAKETAAPVTLSSVSVKADASEYEDGYKLTKNDLTVTAAYSDGSKKTVTDYTISQTGTSLYVTFGGLTSNTIKISYKAVLSSVSVKANATEYENGYQLVKSDLTVTATYSDGSKKTVTDYSISQSGTSLYVTFGGLTSNTITISYKVVDTTPKLVSVSAELKKDTYLFGYVITLNDLTVTAAYSDGSTKVVTSGLTLYDCSMDAHNAISGLTLNEYIGDFYMLQGYCISVSFEGVESEKVIIPCAYEDGVWLCQDMLTLVNQARVEAGLSELHWDSAAESAILTRAKELEVSYSHTRPNGDFIEDLYANCWGENISVGGYDSRNTVQTCFDGWMQSAGHKACILEGISLATGFACAYTITTDADGNQLSYWVMWVTMN